MIARIETFFDSLPAETKAIVIHAHGEYFFAGLDLTELTVRKAPEAIAHMTRRPATLRTVPNQSNPWIELSS